MEIFILILSSLISVLSPANFAGDKIAENAVRAQFKQVEQINVRIDNAPIHNLAAGKVDRLRVAGRGFYPLDDIRIDTLELETDPINVSRTRLVKGKVLFEEPFGVGVRAVIRQEDVVRALRSKWVAQRIQRLLRGLNQSKQLESSLAQGGLRENLQELRQTLDEYRLLNPRVQILENARIQIQADIEEVQTGEKLQLAIETGIEIREGRQIKLLKPVVSLNQQPVPEELLRGLAENLEQELNLDRLERLLQVRARIFKVRFYKGSLEIAAFLGLPAGFKV
ncbi:MAG: DUF2993 domain-containing protein [Oscillatoriales cyanobacterium C42_A2020_001]|nr:DUF2993 domain-containing protein [Leptolyngbyaceae cyanobacterium C42_A2020_001]